MKALSKVYAIDANVILRFLLRDHEELSPKARSIMVAVQEESLSVVCDPIQLAEVVWVLKSTYGLEREQIADSLIFIVSTNSFHIPDKTRYIHAIMLYRESVKDFGDACACATALEECGGRLLSFDKKLTGVEGINLLESAEK